MLTRTTLTIALLAIAAGCAPHSSSAQAAPAALRVITAQDIALRGGQTAMDGVRLLYPGFLTGRAGATLQTQSRPLPLVYLDGARVDFSTLERIDREDVEKMEYVKPIDAQMRYGNGHQGGAIVVTTRRGN
jgi:hypothetical protein